MQDLTALILPVAPPLDPAWLVHEETSGLRAAKPPIPILERQPLYVAECRALSASMMAVGGRDHHLSQGLLVENLTVKSEIDGFRIPILRYEWEEHVQDVLDEGGDEANGTKGLVVVIYYHGGGLKVGEADSEDLSCRRIAKSGVPNIVLYSIGYRLMPQVPASTCVSDAMDAFTSIRCSKPTAKIIVVGSSSGGELAALVSQMAPRGSIHGVLLRSPVTVDATAELKYVPERFKAWHTSASESFVTTLLDIFTRQTPRDGLQQMPLECSEDELEGLPKTWIQICTNDVLYSDGLCYAKLLQDAGVEVKVDVVYGWPHTFWLKAPHLESALEAEEALITALTWIVDD